MDLSALYFMVYTHLDPTGSFPFGRVTNSLVLYSFLMPPFPSPWHVSIFCQSMSQIER